MISLICQNVKDTLKCWRYGYARPALWETRRWLEMTRKK